VPSKTYHGTLEAYWEQGWEGRISFVFQPDDSKRPIFLQYGHRLTILDDDGAAQWSGVIHFVKRGWRDDHHLDAEIWSYIKQKDVTYAQWMEWFWHKPPLRAILEVEDNMSEMTNDHADVKIHPPVLVLVHLVAAFLLTWLLPFPASLPTIVEVFGAALVLAGLALAFTAVHQMTLAHTTLDPHGSVSVIVTSGPYRFSRNPIYLGFVFTLIGIPLALGSLWGAVLSPVLVMAMNALVIRYEEVYLERKFGEGYAGYKSRVRRWL